MNLFCGNTGLFIFKERVMFFIYVLLLEAPLAVTLFRIGMFKIRDDKSDFEFCTYFNNKNVLFSINCNSLVHKYNINKFNKN